MKEEEPLGKKHRTDSVCLSLNVEDVYKKAKLLAHFEGRSVSSYLRELIKESFQKNKKKIETYGQ